MKIKCILPKFNLSKKNQRLLNEDYTLFLEKITQDITELNDLILQYNETDDVDLLSEIEKKQHFLAWNYPRNLTRYFPHYLRAIFHTLTSELIRIRAYERPSLSTSRPEEILGYFIKTLSPIKFSRLINTLYEKPFKKKKIQHALVNLNLGLYWQRFLKTHHFQCLSDKHARVFKVSNTTHGTTCILRCLKPIHSTSQAIEYQVKQLLGDKGSYFVPIYAEREGLFKAGGSRCVQITPYYHCGNVSEHSAWLSEQVKTTEEWLSYVITIHIQMLAFFIAYHDAGFFLPDAKLENFLVDESANNQEYTLKLIDLKSTRPIHTDGLFHDPQLKDDWNDTLLHTKGSVPEEVVRDKSCSPEKANICMLGLNLYAALMHTRSKYSTRPYRIEPITDVELKKLPNISVTIEKRLKQLLIETTQRNPNDRPSYEKTMHQLTQLKAILPTVSIQRSPPLWLLINLWQEIGSLEHPMGSDILLHELYCVRQ